MHCLVCVNQIQAGKQITPAGGFNKLGVCSSSRMPVSYVNATPHHHHHLILLLLMFTVMNYVLSDRRRISW